MPASRLLDIPPPFYTNPFPPDRHPCVLNRKMLSHESPTSKSPVVRFKNLLRPFRDKRFLFRRLDVQATVPHLLLEVPRVVRRHVKVSSPIFEELVENPELSWMVPVATRRCSAILSTAATDFEQSPATFSVTGRALFDLGVVVRSLVGRGRCGDLGVGFVF